MIDTPTHFTAGMPLFALFSPALAAGAAAAAVAVPLLVHLLFRKRYQIVPWAAIRFLLIAERRHRRRIDQWLLLALRVCALLLPLLAMAATTKWAEDFWQRIRPGQLESVSNVPRTHHVLVIDGSLSMTTRADDGRTRFDHAVGHVENMVRNGNPGDGYTVLFLAGPPQLIVPGPSNDADKVAGEIRKLKVAHTATDTTPTLAMIADIVARSPRAYPRRQVTFLTDLQRSSWAGVLPKPDAAPPEAWRRIMDRADVAVVDVARADVDNLAIVDLALGEPIPLVDVATTLTATVHNYGRIERKLVRVELLLGRPSPGGADALVPIEQKSIETIPVGGRATVTFALEGPARFRERGVHVVQVRLVDDDELPADDTRALAVEARDGLHVMIADGKKGETEPLRRGGEHLARALAPPGTGPTETPARLYRPGERPPDTFDQRWIVSATGLADPTLGDPTGADCVFLCDIPTLTPETVQRLEAHLKRGGGVVIGLGPNAAANREQYNRLLYNDGNGILPGPLGEVVTVPPDDPGYRLFADDEAYRRPPLAAFRADNDRAALVSLASFRSYIRLNAPPDGRARRILSFIHAGGAIDNDRKPDPAIVEWPWHRGRVVVYTSSFNQDWTNWPRIPTYLPFTHELLWFASANPDRHTLRAGEAIEEFFPVSAVGLSAGLSGPDGLSAKLPIALQDEAAVARYPDTSISGIYRMGVSGARDRAFAVNVPEAGPSGGAESDLKRVEPADLKSIGPIQLVTDPSEVKPGGDEAAFVVSTPKPWGPMIARYAIIVVLFILALETILAWRFGPSRAPGSNTAAGSVQPIEKRWYLTLLGSLLALVPLALAVFVLVVLFHAEWTGNLLGFVPDGWRRAVETSLGVPTPAPGESTKWRLEGFTGFVRNRITDRWIVGILAGLALVVAACAYIGERGAVRGSRRVAAMIAAPFVGVIPALFGALPVRLLIPAIVRAVIFLLVLFVLLAQLRLAFDREGWPEVVILIDTSASMATVDDLKDPEVRKKAEQLRKIGNLSEAHRLQLAQLLLTRKDADWLDRLLTEKQVKVYIYAVDTQTRLIADLYEAEDAERGREALRNLKPEGDGSHLGDGVEAALKAFRGGSLSAIIMFTDGITTAGDDLPKAGREASRAGVPLFLVGMGDARQTPDLSIGDLQAEDVVTKGDKLPFAARLSARGPVPTEPLPVILYEKQGDKLIERGRVMVRPDPSGNPVSIKITHTPMEVGEKVFVLEVPPQPGEAETGNNRVERTILVTESKRIRVLYVEGGTRYEFRFVKVLLERESDRIAGNKSIDMRTVLLDASRGWPETDKSALPDFPTRDQLFEYDVVILGDVDPKTLPRGSRTAQDIADFVKVRGGGLMVLSGEHAGVAAFNETALAEVLPVIPSESAPPRRTSEEQPITEGYRPKLTPTGRLHPLFRFSPDEAESDRIWNRLQPLLWYAKGYRRKLSAEVLAEHPTQFAEGGAGGEKHPLILQQFTGAGRVIFMGIDETWRWRWRDDEQQFNRFWLQAVRVLSRSRLGRIEVKTDKQTAYRRDERIIVTVRFPDDAPAPPDSTTVRVSVQRGPLPNPDGTPGSGEVETQVLSLAKVEGSRATYQAVLTRTPVGEYRFLLVEPEVNGNRPRAEAKVLPPPTERDRLEMNRADMTAAAAISNGGFYTLADADKLLDDMKDLSRVPLNQPCPPTPLWNQPAMFGLLLMLLIAEWLLRKRERLL